MKTNQNQWVIIRSIWFWWIFTTLIYLAIPGYKEETAITLGHIVGYISGLVGLFVPYGYLSLVLFIFPLTWVSLVVFLVLMVLIDLKLNKQNFSLSKRILINLLALLILTTMVDLIRGTAFESWWIFFNGGFPSLVGFG
ncbi:MAG: hypothetical protein Q7R59_02875 [bacterium]|nr:hypothetical protein [bacterium]